MQLCSADVTDTSSRPSSAEKIGPSTWPNSTKETCPSVQSSSTEQLCISAWPDSANEIGLSVCFSSVDENGLWAQLSSAETGLSAWPNSAELFGSPLWLSSAWLNSVENSLSVGISSAEEPSLSPWFSSKDNGMCAQFSSARECDMSAGLSSADDIGSSWHQLSSNPKLRWQHGSRSCSSKLSNSMSLSALLRVKFSVVLAPSSAPAATTSISSTSGTRYDRQATIHICTSEQQHFIYGCTRQDTVNLSAVQTVCWWTAAGRVSHVTDWIWKDLSLLSCVYSSDHMTCRLVVCRWRGNQVTDEAQCEHQNCCISTSKTPHWLTLEMYFQHSKCFWKPYNADWLLYGEPSSRHAEPTAANYNVRQLGW